MNVSKVVGVEPVIRSFTIPTSHGGGVDRVGGHVAEAFGVVGEVVGDFVVADVDHVGDVGGHGLDVLRGGGGVS